MRPYHLSVEYLGGMCPTQAEGKLTVAEEGEFTLFFRFRHDCAQFWIWRPEHNYEFFTPAFWEGYYEQRDVTGEKEWGFLEEEHVHDLIGKWVEKFVALFPEEDAA